MLIRILLFLGALVVFSCKNEPPTTNIDEVATPALPSKQFTCTYAFTHSPDVVYSLPLTRDSLIVFSSGDTLSRRQALILQSFQEVDSIHLLVGDYTCGFGVKSIGGKISGYRDGQEVWSTRIAYIHAIDSRPVQVLEIEQYIGKYRACNKEDAIDITRSVYPAVLKLFKSKTLRKPRVMEAEVHVSVRPNLDQK